MVNDFLFNFETILIKIVLICSRRYLPVLKDMPLRYLFEPWTAPKAVQEKAQCIIGVDYPSPIVEHQKASKQCRYLMNEVRDKLLQINNGTVHTLALNPFYPD